MVDIGYKLSSELHSPKDLIENAVLAEMAAFDFASISDHFHPWLDRQGESPMVWPVIGGIAQATDDIPIMTGVTCPIIRIHPAIVAQGAATAGAMLDGRFSFGVGTGENLSEHILGDRWPPHHVRLDMLEEAVEIIQGLWTGELFNFDGKYYTVENAKLYSIPDTPPPILFAADGPKTASRAGTIADGIIAVSPDSEIVDAIESTAESAPRYGEVTVCWGESTESAAETFHERWAQGMLPGSLHWNLPTPAQFEDAVQMTSKDDIADNVPCGNDPTEHIDAIQTFVDSGFDHVVVHHVGPDQRQFIDFYEESVIPELT